jgi:hypothetical protein
VLGHEAFREFGIRGSACFGAGQARAKNTHTLIIERSRILGNELIGGVAAAHHQRV